MAADSSASASLKSEPEATPTRVRYGVLAFLCSLSFVLYIDRICISQSATAIEQELDISHTAMGFVFGAFTVAYGLFEIPTGRWGDRYGSRGVLTRIVLWWSAFTALTGCVWRFSWDSGYQLSLPGFGLAVPLAFNSLLLLIVIRFLFGAGEAGALPNAARVLARWFPAGARGPAQGMINTSALLGGALAPMAAEYLSQFVHWRWSFVIFGSLGIVWAVPFYRWFRDDPAEHPRVNAAERRRIAAGALRIAEGSSHPPVPWGRVLTSANVWLAGGVITCSAFSSYMYFFWYPTYLKEGRHVEPATASRLASLVLAGGALGAVLGGYLGDWMVRHTGSRRWSRRLIGWSTLSLAALALWSSLGCDSALAAASLTALACLSANAHLASWWAAVTEMSGKHVGALFGLMNSMGVPGAVASQLFYGRFVDWQKARGLLGREQWDPGFYVYVAALLLAGFGWLFIDATRSVVDPPPKND